MHELLLSFLLATAMTQAGGSPTRVMVQDFEKVSDQPTVWVVNIPNENASVKLSGDRPHEGKTCLALHYKFVGTGQFQYLGIPNKVKILAPVHQLRFWLNGDNSKCSYGVQLSDASGETHQYSKNTGQCGLIDFTGWREVVIDLDSGHETWGGDKNAQIDYPITTITFGVGQPTDQAKLLAAEGDLSFDAISADSGKSALHTPGRHVAVVSPAYCSEVRGGTRVTLAAPGFQSVTVKCWKQGAGLGIDATVANVKLDGKGSGAFVFPADEYPHGPVTLRITGSAGGVKDNCYLQLYNKGGVSWREGLPADPRAARGMKLVFADDFRGPLSISSTDPKATYYDHKPPSGYQDFSVHVFSGHDSPKNPFARVDSYLRIRASDKTKSSGLISSMRNDGSGIKVNSPCYFECRFVGPNAAGTWPGFWLMTDFLTDYKVKGDKTPCDELDIIEAYGGEGPRAPNAGDAYMISPHCWNQGEQGKAIEKKAYDGMHNPIRMHKAGIPSTWFETFHVYGCKITDVDTIYYCDDIEVGRHATLPVCKVRPLFFMVNLATGGGWPVDLSRYGGVADMYIDYVRVYKQDSPAGVRVSEATLHGDMDCYKIETPTATYLYGKRGAGFVSILDKDGRDWISYRPDGKARGEYRGLPKCGQPTKFFHCGYGYGQYATDNPFTSRVTVREAGHARIESETRDGKSACAWDFYPDHAALSLLRIGQPTYWFLYEGTPGGKLDARDDFVLRPDGTRTTLDEPWSQVVPWVCFGAAETPVGLVLVNHQEPERGEMDSYVSWPFRRESDGSYQDMTVFGFGRKGYKELVEHVPDLKKLPARFSIGFIDRAEHAAAKVVCERLRAEAAG